MGRTELDTKPIYTNLVKGYSKHKTKDGYSFDSAYFKRYYSSLDAEIYFGNEYVEEVVDINWSIMQGQMPLFGFNSYVYDEVALGSRIIQGQFAINFTSPNYLFRLLETAKGDSITSMGNYTVNKTKEELTIQERKTTGTSGFTPSDHAPIWPQNFDIDMIFGDKTSSGTPVHIVLEGVMIKDSRMGLGISGEPVMEIYSFIARDIKTVE
jgi:hypothetical protein